MNLIDAVKSGKPFRQKGYTEWNEGGFTGPFYAHQILSDAWEIQEKKITLTKFEFYNAVADTMKELALKEGYRFTSPYGLSDRPLDVTDFKGWTELAAKLGFE